MQKLINKRYGDGAYGVLVDALCRGRIQACGNLVDGETGPFKRWGVDL